MNTSSLKLLALLAVLGLLGMGPGMCKRVDMTEQQKSISTEPDRQPATVVTETHPGKVEGKTEVAPSPGEEVEDSDARRFVMVYQALMDGETDPCG